MKNSIKITLFTIFTVTILVVSGCKQNKTPATTTYSAHEPDKTAHTTEIPLDTSNAPTDKKKTSTNTQDEPGLNGAKKVISEFLKKDANFVALTKKLKPSLDDCKALVNNESTAQKVFAASEKSFSNIQNDPVKPSAGQDDYLVYLTNTTKLKSNVWDNDTTAHFPSGYKTIALVLKPNIDICAFKFVKKGSTTGMSYDGLTFVNNHWVLLPKMWKMF